MGSRYRIESEGGEGWEAKKWGIPRAGGWKKEVKNNIE